MEATAQLAGFFAAHAIWSVSDGSLLIPILATEDAMGKRTMNRLMSERIEEGVEQGRHQLENLPDDATRAVLAFDGQITLDTGKLDAIILDARCPENAARLLMAIPYRPVDSDQGFAVYRPKFLEVVPSPEDFSPFAEAFYQGVDSHEKAAEVWNSHLDQSL